MFNSLKIDQFEWIDPDPFSVEEKRAEAEKKVAAQVIEEHLVPLLKEFEIEFRESYFNQATVFHNVDHVNFFWFDESNHQHQVVLNFNQDFTRLILNAGRAVCDEPIANTDRRRNQSRFRYRQELKLTGKHSQSWREELKEAFVFILQENQAADKRKNERFNDFPFAQKPTEYRK